MAYEPVRPEAPLPQPEGAAPSYYPPDYVPEPAERPSLVKRAGGGLAAAGLLAAKFATKLKLLLVALPKLKLLTTSVSMLVSVAAYSLIFTWKFAIGFVILLLVHELGHVIQLRREGVPASAPLFIPFMGAVVGMKRMPDDAGAEARVGLAGPVLGSIGCLVPVALWQATGAEWLQALAFTGFFLNLFNLLPVVPLDGGRAMAALTPAMWIVGFVLLLAVGIAFPNPIILIIVLFGGLETWRRWRTRNTPEAQAYYRVSRATRIGVAAVYLGLAAALVVGMDLTHLARDFGDV